MNTGSYNIGGSVATASGLLFIGATDDQRIHAYDSKTGKLLWETKLPANAYANPIVYQGKDGKQYVAIRGAGNHGRVSTAVENTVMKAHTYINFSGNCKEAFAYYEKHLGA